MVTYSMLFLFLNSFKSEFVKKQAAQATFIFTISSITSIIVYLFLIVFAPTSTEDIYHMIVTGSLLLVGLVSLASVAVAILVTNLNVYLGIACFVGIGAVVVNDFVLIAMKKFKDCYGREIIDERLK